MKQNRRGIPLKGVIRMSSDGVDWFLAAHKRDCRFLAYEGSN